MRKIALTGVTGNLGRVALEDLLLRVSPADLIAVARAPERAAAFAERGVEVRYGDYDVPASLDAALAGVDVLLFVSGSDVTPGVRVRQHRAVVAAARRAGVQHLVYTSGIGAENGQGLIADHTATEQAIRGSGLAYTFLRNAFYTEAFAAGALAQARAHGEVTSSTEGHPLNTARLRDLALAASAVVTGAGHADATYELRGPLWTYPELAAVLSRRLGTPVAYREVTDAESGWLGALFPQVRAGAFAHGSPDLERLLGRPPATLDETVDAMLRRTGGAG